MDQAQDRQQTQALNGGVQAGATRPHLRDELSCKMGDRDPKRQSPVSRASVDLHVGDGLFRHSSGSRCWSTACTTMAAMLSVTRTRWRRRLSWYRGSLATQPQVVVWKQASSDSIWQAGGRIRPQSVCRLVLAGPLQARPSRSCRAAGRWVLECLSALGRPCRGSATVSRGATSRCWSAIHAGLCAASTWRRSSCGPCLAPHQSEAAKEETKDTASKLVRCKEWTKVGVRVEARSEYLLPGVSRTARVEVRSVSELGPLDSLCMLRVSSPC